MQDIFCKFHITSVDYTLAVVVIIIILILMAGWVCGTAPQVMDSPQKTTATLGPPVYQQRRAEQASSETLKSLYRTGVQCLVTSH